DLVFGHRPAPESVPPGGEFVAPVVHGLSAAILADPIAFDPAYRSGSPALALAPVRIRRAGNVAIVPGAALSPAIGASAFRPFAPAVHRTALHAGTLARKAAKRFGAFDVTFDSAPIVFDVAPRIEHGMPLAPFRQIFEHTGGTVEWFQHTQTVRAVNSEREIEFRIGASHAMVNHQEVKMQRASYVDSGRTIVPLSFIRDSMNVNVSFDPATGHLLIESKR
ncbi:MAG TPA: copper amine oxidase N-terminal domain-containing protein, partial [Chthonomonadales bacterium]|nr:copper amine oxidase N-terminal domain-containing protein [Chthonomonadales bacterium]